MIIQQFHANSTSIELLQNRSITWRQMCWVVASLGCLSLSVALFWALQGAWIIFPFAGLEVALLAYLSLRVSSNSYHKQVVHIQESQIHIEWGAIYPKKNWYFEREQSTFIIHRAKHSLSPDHVELRDKSGQSLRLGEALNKQDIDQFIEIIRASGLYYQIKGRNTTKALDENEIFR